MDMTGAGHSPARMHAKRGTSFLLCRRSRVSRFACTFYLDQGIFTIRTGMFDAISHTQDRKGTREGKGGGGGGGLFAISIRILYAFPTPSHTLPLSPLSPPAFPSPKYRRRLRRLYRSLPMPPPRPPTPPQLPPPWPSSPPPCASATLRGRTSERQQQASRVDGKMDSNADAVVETRSFSAEEQRGAYGSEAVNAVLEAHLLNPVLALLGWGPASWGSRVSLVTSIATTASHPYRPLCHERR